LLNLALRLPLRSLLKHLSLALLLLDLTFLLTSLSRRHPALLAPAAVAVSTGLIVAAAPITFITVTAILLAAAIAAVSLLTTAVALAISLTLCRNAHAKAGDEGQCQCKAA